VSCYWDLHCVDCGETWDLEMNHAGETLHKVCAHAKELAALTWLDEVDVNLDFYGGRMVPIAWFARHKDHRVLPLNEYGRFMVAGPDGKLVEVEGRRLADGGWTLP